MDATDDREYLLGTGDIELERLARQHLIWAGHTDALLDRAGFSAGQTVIDLGAGPGFASLTLAERVGAAGKVVAVDASNRFAAHLAEMAARRGLDRIEYRIGDVHDLDLGRGEADGVFARWLFCFLDNPEAVIENAARALKTNGRFAIFDYFNYLAVGFEPPAPELARPFHAVRQSFIDNGGDLDIGGKLPSMLAQRGFVVEAIMPFCEIARPGGPFWRWFLEFKESFFPKLAGGGYMNKTELAAFEAALHARANDEGAFFFPPPMLGVVARKG